MFQSSFLELLLFEAIFVFYFICIVHDDNIVYLSEYRLLHILRKFNSTFSNIHYYRSKFNYKKLSLETLQKA